MKQLDIENQLRDVVSRVMAQVELATAQGRTDINLALEDAFIPIMKSVYNLPHLVNLNRKQRNFPGIDLGDDHDRVAFQITSTTSLEKVKSTLQQFMERKYYSSFDELYILMLSKKQGSYSQASINGVLSDDFAFNGKKHIIDLIDLVGAVTGLRLTAQERVLSDFKQILGEVDAYNSFSAETVAAPVTITANLQQIALPDAVYVAELTIDEKAVVERARAELSYKRRKRGARSIVKMALLLNGEGSDAWVCYDGKLFSFRDIETCGLRSIVDEGSIERLEAADFTDPSQPDNVNILKQLLFAETQERLKKHHVRTHARDRFFFFGPQGEDVKERKESWVGKRSAIRKVYELKYHKKDPSKVAHHQHLSFNLGFMPLGDAWYAQIVPSWYHSYNGYKQSHWHEKLLSNQKRLEHNMTVRNQVRFIAHFLAEANESPSAGLRFQSLVEFRNVDAGDAIDTAEDIEDEDINEVAA